jgi:hypothetical protein
MDGAGNWRAEDDAGDAGDEVDVAGREGVLQGLEVILRRGIYAVAC